MIEWEAVATQIRLRGIPPVPLSHYENAACMKGDVPWPTVDAADLGCNHVQDCTLNSILQKVMKMENHSRLLGKAKVATSYLDEGNSTPRLQAMCVCIIIANRLEMV